MGGLPDWYREGGKKISPGRLIRLGVPASVGASILWMLVWLHQRATHGATEENEERILFGLT